MDGLDANSSYLTYCLTPVVSTAVESQTVSSLWGPVAVADGGLGVSGPLAQSASVAGGLESWGNNSGPAWVALGQDWGVTVTVGVSISITLAKALGRPVAEGDTSGVDAGTAESAEGSVAVAVTIGISISVALAKALGRPVAEGDTATVMSGDSASVSVSKTGVSVSIGISRALANGMGEGTIAIVVDAESSVGAGLTDESTGTKTEGISIGITLAIGTLWGPVAVGETSGVDASTAESAVAVAIAKGVGRPFADKVGEAAGGIAAVSRVDAGLTDESAGSQAETAIAVAKSVGVSVALAKALWGPVGEGDASGVSGDAAAVSKTQGEWGVAVAPGVSGPLAPASPAGGLESWAVGRGPVLLVEAVAVEGVSLGGSQEASKSNKKLHICAKCVFNPL